MTKGLLVLKAPELKRHVRKIADYCGVSVRHGSVNNPTLVHHGLAAAARWHITTHEPPRKAVADLYMGTQAEAHRVTRLLASMIGMQLEMLNNSGTPKLLKDHPRTLASATPNARARRPALSRTAGNGGRPGSLSGRAGRRKANPNGHVFKTGDRFRVAISEIATVSGETHKLGAKGTVTLAEPHRRGTVYAVFDDLPHKFPEAVSTKWLEHITGNARRRANPKGRNPRARVVYNKLLGGWYVVVGPHQAPLNGRFNSKAEAQAWLAESGRRTNSRSSRQTKRLKRKTGRIIAGSSRVKRARSAAQRAHVRVEHVKRAARRLTNPAGKLIVTGARGKKTLTLEYPATITGWGQLAREMSKRLGHPWTIVSQRVTNPSRSKGARERRAEARLKGLVPRRQLRARSKAQRSHALASSIQRGMRRTGWGATEPGRPRANPKGLDAATRRHLEAWLKQNRRGGIVTARTKIKWALAQYPDLVDRGRSWPEIERLGEDAEALGGRSANPSRRKGARRVSSKSVGKLGAPRRAAVGRRSQRRVLRARHSYNPARRRTGVNAAGAKRRNAAGDTHHGPVKRARVGVAARRGGRVRTAGAQAVGRTRNPSGPIARAKATFKKWQDREVVPRLTRMRATRPLSGAAAELGQLVAVTYRSDKYDGKTKDHEHIFKQPLASLVTDPDGRDLHIVRGRSRFAITPDGIKN